MMNKKTKRILELKTHQFFKGMSTVSLWVMLISLSPAVSEFHAIPKGAWLTYEALPIIVLLGFVGSMLLLLLKVKTLSEKKITRLKTMPS